MNQFLEKVAAQKKRRVSPEVEAVNGLFTAAAGGWVGAQVHKGTRKLTTGTIERGIKRYANRAGPVNSAKHLDALRKGVKFQNAVYKVGTGSAKGISVGSKLVGAGLVGHALYRAIAE